MRFVRGCGEEGRTRAYDGTDVGKHDDGNLLDRLGQTLNSELVSY